VTGGFADGVTGIVGDGNGVGNTVPVDEGLATGNAVPVGDTWTAIVVCPSRDGSTSAGTQPTIARAKDSKPIVKAERFR
jgi:hypothetical protein